MIHVTSAMMNLGGDLPVIKPLRKQTLRIPLVALPLLLQLSQAATPARAQSAASPVQPDPRGAFRFLLGTWKVISHEDSTGTRPSQGETYSFDSIVAGGGIGGRWHFNRGTPDKLDFVDAVYYSGFDGRSSRWSFYYISPQSAQAWPGEFRDGHWYFRQTFEDRETSFEQRQWWEAVGDTLVRRHIENSRDGGRSWSSYIITLRRAG
jgi:hypothetical protein